MTKLYAPIRLYFAAHTTSLIVRTGNDFAESLEIAENFTPELEKPLFLST